ncbi:MAG: hypothetical protein HY815_14080 [Candidatus Riflebacteria bacterium]|nr:hypothetical protein [Candidatus Riflebacteria bacterium]
MRQRSWFLAVTVLSVVLTLWGLSTGGACADPARPSPIVLAQAGGGGEAPLAEYLCQIGDHDLKNSEGKRLKTVAEILRQDRANYHKFKVRDRRDLADETFFASAKNRELFSRVTVQCPPSLAQRIVGSGAIVQVRAYRDRIVVGILGEAESGGTDAPEPAVEPAAAQDGGAITLKPDQEFTVQGKLSEVRSTHPNGSSFKSYILKVGRAIRLEDGDGSCSTDDRLEIHVFGDRIEAKLEGQQVTATGTAFCEHTAWHVRPIVMKVESISSLR